MQLTGYRRACGKRSGGIRSVALVQAGAVAGVKYDGLNRRYTEVTLQSGEAFAVYHFKEDAAVYTERVASDPSGSLVTHTLTMMLERMDAASAEAVQALCKASLYGGLVAIVTFNNGGSFLVGYSDRFGLEYPLRMKTAAGVSGTLLTDACGESVTLACVDTDKACAYTSVLPQ